MLKLNVSVVQEGQFIKGCAKIIKVIIEVYLILSRQEQGGSEEMFEMLTDRLVGVIQVALSLLNDISRLA